MAERATAGLTFYDFLHSVHALLSELLYARNFYVCLSNEVQQTLDFPYYVDEKDGDTMQCNDVPMCRGLTEFVLRTQRPQLIDAARFQTLVSMGEVTEASGDLTFSAWLGVPMLLKGAVGGALVVQNYEADGAYSVGDIEVLSFVANQFGSVIERHQAIEALRSSEARYRVVFEHLGVGVAVVQNGAMQFINPAMVALMGWDRQDLLNQDFTKALHPDDVARVVDRHQRRLKGEAVEPYYVARFVTSTGETRHLEISAALLGWNAQPATLLFAVDVTARQQAEQTQRLALERQQELNDLKTRFIAMASHEFRTPLSSITGSVDLLMHYAERISADERHDALQKIHGAVARMTRMLENVLQVGRAEAGQLTFDPVPVAVAPLSSAVVDEVRASLAPRGIGLGVALHLDFPPATTQCMLDEGLWRHIVSNLVSNALKYSHPGGRVNVVIKVVDAHLSLSVSDTGIGITPHDMPRLFDAFQRGGNVGQISGTGLGLSIVRQAVAAHQGHIDVDSALGQGTCFSIRLPLSVPAKLP